MMSLNEIIKNSGLKEIKTRLIYCNLAPKRYCGKYGIKWVEIEKGNPDADQMPRGYFIGAIDNILNYYEDEMDMENEGISELKDIMEVNNLL